MSITEIIGALVLDNQTIIEFKIEEYEWILVVPESSLHVCV